MRGDHIRPLLDGAALPGMNPGYARAMSREKAEAIINAAVSLYQCPAGGTAAGFAMLDLFVGALGLETWTIKAATHNAHPDRNEISPPPQ